MSILVKRLKPGDDLLAEIEALVHGCKMRAGVIFSAVGSLKQANIRFADQNDATKIKGPFEIVSITGTVCDTSSHIHVALSDSTGKTIGGHLKYDCIVHTTVELVIQDLSSEWTFDRKQCELSGYSELVATSVKGKQ